jgi:fatty acid desaturase
MAARRRTQRPQRAKHYRVYRQPSLWNSFKFRVSLLPVFNPASRFPMSTRRNTIIRAIATVTGDIAFGAAIASACLWLIEVAALGLFLSFLVWLLGLLLSLALSQYVVHPVTELLLSDRKLDVGLAAAAGMANTVTKLGNQFGHGLLRSMKQGAEAVRFRSKPA